LKTPALIALSLVLAAAAQVALAPKVAIFGARPDFLLVTVTLLSMNRSTDSAAVIGFFAGLLNGGVSNTKMAAYVISRIVGAIAASLVGRTTVAATPLTVMGASLACSGLASLAFMLLGVPKDLWSWVLSTFGMIAYNTVLVGIGFAIVRSRRRA
jgi:rod shape-determining protein MreD